MQVTFDIDNYGSLVIKSNVAKRKNDMMEYARTINAIKDMAYEDSVRSGHSLAEILAIIVDSYPSLIDLI